MNRWFAAGLIALAFTLAVSVAAAQSPPDSADPPPPDAEGAGQLTADEPAPADEGVAVDDPSADTADTDDETAAAENGESLPPQPAAENQGEKPIDQRTHDQLTKDGFVFGSSKRGRGSTRATLVAMTAGLFLHGAGHYVADDLRTAYFLLTMEVVGLAFAATGAAAYGASAGADPYSGLAATSVYFGTGLFALSYFFDVLGTISWGSDRGAADERRERGASLALGYRLFRTSALPLLHTGSATASADYGWFAASARTTQEVGLTVGMYEGGVLFRALRLAESRTWLGFGASADSLAFSGTGGFRRTGVAGSIRGQFDLQTLFPHLWGFAIGSEIGLGHQWFALFDSEQAATSEFETSHIPFDIYGDHRWDENIEMRVGYRRDDSMLIPAAGRLSGIPYLRGAFSTGPSVDLLLGLEYGDGPVLDVGLRIWVL